MPFYLWSKTSNANSSVDPTINWNEGQPPSSINDSARAMMARTAEYRDDISGALVTGGTSTAYTIVSNQVFDTLAHLDGQVIAFTPHATSGATVTLNVDGLGAKPLRAVPGVDLPAGVLVQGTPYTVLFNNADNAFYLHGFYGNPYNVPIGAGMDYWGGVAPNSAFAFPVGQAISRSTYAALFSLIGTTFGAGDGSTTFNLPDMRGRIGVPADNMGGAQAFRINNILGNPLGSIGGEQQHQLLVGELPGITSAVTVNVSGSISGTASPQAYVTSAGGPVAANFGNGLGAGTLSISGSFNGSGTGFAQSNNTNGQVHNNVQPSIVCNYIIRVL